jgi:hypothetical protein
MNPLERILQLLAPLSECDLLKVMRDAGCSGICGSVNSCVVADYLRRSGFAHPAIAGGYAHGYIGGDWLTAQLPANLFQLAHNFDNGAYPELVRHG